MSGTLTISQLLTVADINSGVITLDKFDPALGTLTAVDIEVTTPMSGTVGVENLDLTPAFMNATISDNVQLTTRTGRLIASAFVLGNGLEFGAAAFDGTIDDAGPSGTLAAIAGMGDGTNAGFVYDEFPLIGTGTLAVTLSGQVSMEINGGGNIAASESIATGGGTILVQYLYATASAAPADSPPAPPVAPPSPPVSPPAPLTTATQTWVLPEQTTGWTASGTIGQFDPALGTLVQVNVTIETDVTGTVEVENTGHRPDSPQTDIAGYIVVAGPNAGDLGDDYAYTTQQPALGAYDGVTDFAGASGTIETIGTSATGTSAVTDAHDLGAFIGTGTVALTATGAASSDIINDGTGVEQSLARLGGTVEVSYTYIPCFAAGTRIATPTGAVPIEALRPGDLVRSVLRGTATVRATLHRRVACRTNKAALLPVRIRADAFAPGQPARDLLLSPDHAVYAEGVLIPVRYLVDGAWITRAALDVVSYWHLELDQHDVILAEGLPTESYLDTDHRAGFAPGGQALPAAGLAARAWEAAGCAPLVVTGPLLARVRARLAAR
jgi:hypothetical protein